VILRYVAKEGIKNPEKQLQLFNFKHWYRTPCCAEVH
jgi:hypothetical protein